jgi:hypothetical protein
MHRFVFYGTLLAFGAEYGHGWIELVLMISPDRDLWTNVTF